MFPLQAFCTCFVHFFLLHFSVSEMCFFGFFEAGTVSNHRMFQIHSKSPIIQNHLQLFAGHHVSLLNWQLLLVSQGSGTRKTSAFGFRAFSSSARLRTFTLSLSSTQSRSSSSSSFAFYFPKIRLFLPSSSCISAFSFSLPIASSSASENTSLQSTQPLRQQRNHLKFQIQSLQIMLLYCIFLRHVNHFFLIRFYLRLQRHQELAFLPLLPALPLIIIWPCLFKFEFCFLFVAYSLQFFIFVFFICQF